MQATIHTLAVSSQPADPAAVPPELFARLPPGWQLSAHQLATYQALCGEQSAQTDIVINSAMTGDGKSIAGLLPYITGQGPEGVLALYPTNELIRDQWASAKKSLETWQRNARSVTTLNGARLDELTAKSNVLKRPGILVKELKSRPIVLTNPDILHAMLQFIYQQPMHDPTNILRIITDSFQQLTFDEFHIFDTAQVTAVMIGLLLLYETANRPLKTLFLSATPEGLLQAMLKRAGFADNRIKRIDPQSAGWYAHGTAPDANWRPILQASSITFVDQQAEEWVPANLDRTILAWFRKHGRHARAAIIVNSVAKALRLTALLQAHLKPEGLTVLANTGMTGSEDRKASYDAAVLVGTSTVDVGVDFRINLLIFESSDAGSFLQRLGRLGRHKSYQTPDGRAHDFHEFAAYALVPTFVAERLFAPREQQQEPLLTDGATITRAELGQHIGAAYPPFAEFKRYAQHWGCFQAAKVYATLSTRNLSKTFADARKRLKDRYAHLLGVSVTKTWYRWDELVLAGEKLLVEEAQSFRGGSPFDCAVFQKSDAGKDEVITYDLLMLLANFQLEWLERQAFIQQAKQLGIETLPYEHTPPRQLAYFRRLNYFETFQEVTVVLRPTIADWDDTRYQKAQVLPGLELDCRPHEWLGELNLKLLRNHPVVALLVRNHSPLRIRSRLKLPGTFRLHQYRFGGEGQIEGSIAFGREALLLDSRLRYHKLEMPGAGPIIT